MRRLRASSSASAPFSVCASASTSVSGFIFTSVALLLLLPALFLQPCLATDLVVRDDDVDIPPGPISVAPDQFWGGIDGSWSTFALRLGEPEQFLRVLVSTASQQTWAIHKEACLKNQTDPDTNITTLEPDTQCQDDRGHVYNLNASSTWKDRGFYQLWLEQNLGLNGNGAYGYDTVGVGFLGDMGPTVKNCTVGTLISEHFWLGHIGVNPKPTNFSAFSDPSPSWMTYLFQQKHIPSVSFGYTAGARYHLAEVLGSLTLGGYDASRIVPNDLTFLFAPNNERDLVVGVVGITSNSATKTDVNLLNRDQFTMYIDSTVAEIWLPTKVCESFEQAFGLKYDEDTSLYLVDDLLHQTLLADNASVTFSLGQKSMTNATVDITLPYAAFDLTAKPPFRGLNESKRYFPIRRGQTENQFVFGRTFLQEAYLTVDWERQNFSISQVNWEFGQGKEIVPIISPNYPQDMYGSPAGPKRLSNGTIIGIAVGGGFAIALVVFAVLWFFWRKRQKKRLASVKAEYEAQATAAAAKVVPAEKRDEDPTSPIDKEEGSNVFPKAELPAEFVRLELSGDTKEDVSPGVTAIPSPVVEAENTERQVFEMEGDTPTTQEAGGRQLSEKESMVVRERIYNGIDPSGTPAVSPLTEEPPSRPPPLLPSDVAMVNRRIPYSVSPTTPRTPRDGALLEASDTFFQPPSARNRYFEAEDTLLSPISPLEGSTDTSRRRFSYES